MSNMYYSTATCTFSYYLKKENKRQGLLLALNVFSGQWLE